MSRLPEPRYKVNLRAEGGKHFYDVEGHGTFSGVTGYLDIISKPALVPWATKVALERVREVLVGRLGEEGKRRISLDSVWIDSLISEAKKKPKQIKDDAADLGTMAHAWIDGWILGQIAGSPFMPEPDQRIKNAVDAFLLWVKDCGLEFVAGDTKIASLEHGFGGSLDALGKLPDGSFVILDWKSSKGIYESYALQVAAYEQGLFETYGIGAKELRIVRFSKEAPVEFEHKTVRADKRPFQAFLHAKNLAELLKEPMFV